MKLFRIAGNAELEVVNESSYRDREVGAFGEVTLQKLFIDYPELIPAEEINADDPPKLLVIRNEAGVTAGSMDILYVDHKGVPTVVEAKLVDNREIRRSVLGQGLEYLAYLKTEWNAERMLEEGNSFWKARGSDLDSEAIAKLGVPFDEDLMAKITQNIQSNKMRLIVASDKIPPELRRIIEFLNDASIFDVMGVEVRLFVSKDNNYRILAPQLVGISETTKERKLKGPVTRWTFERFFEALENNYPDALPIVQELYVFGREVTNRDVEWGAGKERGSYTARLVIGKDRFSLFSVYTNAQFSINFGWNSTRLERIEPDISERYRMKVKEELSINFEKTTWEKAWPMADLSLLLPDRKEAFKKIVSDFIAEVHGKLL